jgi:EmrB/QacA subfamily drug resistance transporter
MPRRLLVVVLMVQFMVSLDVSVVNVALPAVRSGLGFDDAGLTWVVNAYTLAFGGLMMLGGRLGDVLGRRRTLLGGLVLFGLASLAGGLMQSPGGLIAARAVQGAGAAALTPVALALLTTGFPPGPALSRALALWGVTAALGGALGVLAGGVLTQWLSWRAVLLVNLPIVALALVLALGRFEGEKRRPGARLDLAGAVLATTGAALLVLGVVRTQSEPWTSAQTVLTLAAAALALACFALVERRTEQPLLRLGLLTRRPVLGANVFMALLFSAQFAAFYFASLYLHNVLGYGPARAGASFVPFSAGVVVGSALAGRLAARIGLRAFAATGAFLAACGFGWFGLAFAGGGGFAAAVLGPSLVVSTGIGMCFVPLGTAGAAGVPAGEAGMAAGLLNSSRQVGGSIGLAALVTLATHVSDRNAHGGGSNRTALAHGYGAAVGAGAGLLALAAVAALALLPGRPAHGSRPAAPRSDADGRGLRGPVGSPR